MTNTTQSWCTSRSIFTAFRWKVINLLFFKNPIFGNQNYKIQLLKRFGAQVGADISLGSGLSITQPWNFKIGNMVKIGKGVKIICHAPVTLQDRVEIQNGVILNTKSCPLKHKHLTQIECAITLKNDTQIGHNSIVEAGVICYSGSSLAPNSQATTDLAPNCHYEGQKACFKHRGITKFKPLNKFKKLSVHLTNPPKKAFSIPFSVSF